MPSAIRVLTLRLWIRSLKWCLFLGAERLPADWESEDDPVLYGDVRDNSFE
jgi:hypothetical protein